MYLHLPKPFEKLFLYEWLPFDWLRGKVTADF